jgi:hypothetical protein
LDQGYVLAVPPKVEVGNYFSLKWVDFTKKWQNWRMDGGDHASACKDYIAKARSKIYNRLRVGAELLLKVVSRPLRNPLTPTVMGTPPPFSVIADAVEIGTWALVAGTWVPVPFASCISASFRLRKAS